MEFPATDREEAKNRVVELIKNQITKQFKVVQNPYLETYYSNEIYFIRDLHEENIMTKGNIFENPAEHLYIIDTNCSLNDVKEIGGLRQYGDYSLIYSHEKELKEIITDFLEEIPQGKEILEKILDKKLPEKQEVKSITEETANTVIDMKIEKEFLARLEELKEKFKNL